jgi:hypothetical protein
MNVKGQSKLRPRILSGSNLQKVCSEYKVWLSKQFLGLKYKKWMDCTIDGEGKNCPLNRISIGHKLLKFSKFVISSVQYIDLLGSRLSLNSKDDLEGGSFTIIGAL